MMTDTKSLTLELTGALVDLIRVASGTELPPEVNLMIMEGLMKTDPLAKHNEQDLVEQIRKTRLAKRTLMPFCEGCAAGCSLKENFDVNILIGGDKETREAKEQLMLSLAEMAGYVHAALLQGISDDQVNAYFWKSLRMLGMDFPADDLWPIVDEAGVINLQCLDLYARANQAKGQ